MCSNLLGDDPPGNLVVSSSKDNLLRFQVGLGLVGTPLDNLLCVCIAD